MKTIDFRTSGYFPWTVLFLGAVLVFVGAFILMSHPVAAGIIFVIGVIIFTTHYRLTVDFENKAYHDYLWILGMKHGDKGKFGNIDYLFMKKQMVSQKMNHLAGSTIFRKEVFDGYLRFSATEIIHLSTHRKKEDLLKQLEGISKKLGVQIVDYTHS